MNIPRNEYPRPQMVRKEWTNLNGLWDFEFDFSQSGIAREFYKKGEFTKKILVPFAPESSLSGIEFKDFIPGCWYRRNITITKKQLEGTCLLHFGAVDYHAVVYINGIQAGSHIGGYSSFYIDITPYINEGENTIVVYAEDNQRSGKQPRGKQSSSYYSGGCDYTRTTGIWQTVWLEFVPHSRIVSYKVVPDLNNRAVDITINLVGSASGMTLKVTAEFQGQEMGTTSVIANHNTASLRLNLKEAHPWDAGIPNLYDIQIDLVSDNTTKDTITGYFGLRSVYLKDNAIYLNNRPLFQRLVLDQGFYPEGVYTAPSDDMFIKDIELSMELGFNGARLHEKVFEPRFLYHADKMGYLVWGEHANWGLDHSKPEALHHFLPEWLEVVARDFNHPSIIGWCPFNETWDIDRRKQHDETLRLVYLATKAADPTRPVIDTSGNYHVQTDIYDVHDYDQNPESFASKYRHLKKGEIHETFPERQKHSGQPFFVSEYGGAWWSKAEGGWGYGESPKTEEEFASRYTLLTKALIESEGVCAFCYTQLYDIEQEQNGLYTYERTPKFSKKTYGAIKEVNTQKAKIEN